MVKRVSADKSLGVAYIRVSTDVDKQALGAEAQRQAIEAWSAKNGVRIVSWVTEEVSGGAKLDERTGLLEALATVEAERAGHLVVQRLDRFSRDPFTAMLAEHELQRSGAKLSIALGCDDSNDPAAELMRSVLLAVGRFERRMIGARIKAALAVKKRRGECVGECSFGFTRGETGRLVANDSEQRVTELVRGMVAEGLSQRAIARRLASDGVVGRSGKPYSQTQVGRIARIAA
jgi:DNA invertase Pin-like site-specific DNA recombinase